MLRLRFSTLGPHRVGLTVTDPTGQSSSVAGTVEVVPVPIDDAPIATTPPPATQTTPATPPPAVTLPRVVAPPGIPATVGALLLSRRVTRGGLHVRVTCRQTAPCRGTVVLRSGRGKAAVRLGRAAFVARRGHPAVVTVAVGKAGRRALRRSGTGGATVAVAVLRRTGKLWTDGEGGRVRP